MKYMGLDLGSKTLGISISDNTNTIANVYKTLYFEDENYDSLIAPLSNIIKENNIGKIILGYPKNMNGTKSQKTEKVDSLIPQLEALGLKVHTWDERLTTVSA